MNVSSHFLMVFLIIMLIREGQCKVIAAMTSLMKNKSDMAQKVQASILDYKKESQFILKELKDDNKVEKLTFLSQLTDLMLEKLRPEYFI